MDVLMDGLLATATLFAGGYCWVLARRVRDLKSLDKGLGGAIVTLTRQVELARTTLEEARGTAGDSRQELSQLVARADTAAGQLRLLIATVGEPAARRAAPAEDPIRAAPAVRPAADRAPIALDEPEPEPAEPEPSAEVSAAEALPKPRALPPIENPLRRRGADEAPPRSEEELLAALNAMAGSGGR